VEEIEFDGNEEIGTLVVDGILSTNTDSNFIYLSRTSQVQLQYFPPEEGALIQLYDKNGMEEDYQEIEPGKYYLKGNIDIKVGGSYYIKLLTKNGHTYQSEIETIISVPSIDSLSNEITIEEYIDDEIGFLNGSFFNIFVHGRIPDKKKQIFLKWDVENIYLMTERKCNPVTGPKTCYVKRPININEIILLVGQKYESSASYTQRVVHQRIDFGFGIVTSFYVSQKSITENAYTYWSNVRQIIEETGTIFENTPALVKGNIKPISHPDDEVLGYFSAADEKKQLKMVTKGDLGINNRKLPLCHPDLNLPSGFRPGVCCDCELLSNASTNRPNYWP